MIKKIKYLVVEIISLGLVKGLFRIFYEFAKKVKLMKAYDFWFRFLNRKKKVIPDTFREHSFGNFFLPEKPVIERFLKKLPTEEKEKIVLTADQICKGTILTFSRILRNYGNPPDFHYNPLKKVTWPNDLHFTEIRETSHLGDIKLVWELNRFSHVFYLVRAYYLTGNEKYIRTFVQHVNEWIKQNPYPYGVNWGSGQEIAIRLFAWVFGFFAFQKYLLEDQKFLSNFFQSIWWQVKQIERHIFYAYYAVHNNHLIGEAAALYILGKIFPFFPDSKKWVQKGRKILLKKSPEQFYEDGGYCQLSHNYHRLALHYLVWVVRTGEINEDPFPRLIYDMIRESANFLYQNMHLASGQLPNWGSNDGALLNPWTNCDYSDFRPLLSVLFYLTDGIRIFNSGVWDEELIWFMGKLPDSKKEKKQRSLSYKKTGIHILRKDQHNFLVFRCGSYPDRFGHADQNHVDLWLNGKNILVDGGSYLYNDEPRYHRYLMGTKSHNTVVVDEKDQMLLWRKFKWLYMPSARVLYFDDNRITGESYGYHWLDKGLRHFRTIDWKNRDKIIICDKIINNYQNFHHFQAHFQMDMQSVQLLREEGPLKSFQLETSEGKMYLYMMFTGIPEDTREDIQIQKGMDQNNIVDGWISRYYSDKKPVYSVRHNIYTNEKVIYHMTWISFNKKGEEEFANEALAYSSDLCNT
jgi:asparagine synthase (glutamine-hydrolysing)